MGAVPCGVTEVRPHPRFVYPFNGTWTLVAEDAGTGLLLEHSGFDLDESAAGTRSTARAPAGGTRPAPDRPPRSRADLSNPATPLMITTRRWCALKGISDGTGGTDGYTAAKFAVVGLMEAYAKRLAPHRIRVNTVHPTGVLTPMIVNESFGAFMAQNPHLAVAMQNLLPVPLIEADDVSDVVVWLTSDAAKYVTGVRLPVDAGYSVR